MKSAKTYPNEQANETGVFQRLRRGGAWIFLGRSMGMGIVFGITVLLAKWLPEQDFASYVVTISLVTLTSVIAMCGLNNLMCRVVSAFYSAGEGTTARESFFRIYWIALTSVGLTSTLFFGIHQWLFEVLGSPELKEHIWLILGWIGLLSMSQIIAEAFRGLHNLFAASILAGISGGLLANSIFVASIIGMKLTGQLNYANVVMAGAGSFLVPIVIGPIWLFFTWPKRSQVAGESSDERALESESSHRKNLPKHSFAGLLVEAFPIMLMNISAYGFDLSGHLICKASGNDLQVSAFEAIWKLGFLVIIPLTMLGLAASSTISEQFSVGNRKLLQKVVRSVATISILLSLPMYLALVIFAKPVITILFQEGFAVGAMGLIIIATAQMIRNWTGPCGVALLMTGHQKWAFGCFAIAAPILMLGPWAVSQFGLTGIATVIASAMLTARLGHYFLVRWKLNIVPQADLSLGFLSELFSQVTSFSNPFSSKKVVAQKAQSGNPTV